MNSDKNTAILVLSCDKYADIWPVFFEFFFKYWDDCPFPIYLSTNAEVFQHKRVVQIFSNKNTTWSDELTVILNQIKEERVLIILEDYFIYEKVSNEKIAECINVFSETDAAYLKLACFPKKYDSLWPHKPLVINEKFGLIEKESKYRVCLQIAIWKKEILKSLIDINESPWKFEVEASKRSNIIKNPFLCVLSDPKKTKVHGPITYYCTALTAGKWMRGALELCKSNNIKINFNNRQIETKFEEMKRVIYISSPLFIRKIFNYFGSRLFLK